MFFDVEDEFELFCVGDIVFVDNYEVFGVCSYVKEIMVNCLLLNVLLVCYDVLDMIDFLLIDIEGLEFEILSVFDFLWWKVCLFVVEYGGDEVKREGIFILFIVKGFLCWNIEVFRWDDWYYLDV